MDDVWCFETSTEEFAIYEIAELYARAQTRSGTAERNILKHCFEDSWQTIKTRMEVEGSIWYVWWMDGVRKYIWEHYVEE